MHDNHPVVEWAPFRLASGVDEQTLLERAEELQRDFVDHQRGFVRRELLRAPDGSWVDLVLWTDAAAAHAVIDAARHSPTCERLFSILQGADHGDPAAAVSHYSLVRRWERS